VLVFGATGKQGGAVATALNARGWTVRALVRNLDSDASRALASGGIHLFPGDFSDVASIRTAMAGVQGAFSVQPSSGSAGSGVTDADEVRFGKTVADLAAERGVRHLVYSSAAIITKGPTGMPHLDCKIEIEEHIRSLNIASTIVRPGTFMDLLTLPGMGLNQGTLSFFLRPDQPAQFIAAEDIGKIVATVFGDVGRFAGRTIDIAGDELTGLDLQNVLSEAAGRSIVYHRYPDAVLEDNPFLRAHRRVVQRGARFGERRHRGVEARIWRPVELQGMVGRNW
jgi:uncharacterized protein YbjT (DUF2867 family)